MSALEQVAFGWQCLLGSLRACRLPVIWGPWAALFGLQAAGILAIWWGAHPALSWLVAPLLTAIEGDGALRYPALFLVLPDLARDAGLVTGALALPVFAGVSARLFERHFRGRRPDAGAAWREGLSRAAALLLAALPVTLAAVGLQSMLQMLGVLRFSGITRAVMPPIADGALLFVRVACAYVPALVVLGGRSGPRALADIPSTWREGFLPAAVGVLMLTPAGALASALVAASLAIVERGAPEWVAAAVLARAAVGALLGMLASGAVTLAWLGGVEGGEEEA